MLLQLCVNSYSKCECSETYRFDCLFDVVLLAGQVVVWEGVIHLKRTGRKVSFYETQICFTHHKKKSPASALCVCVNSKKLLTLWQICFMVISSRFASFSRLCTVSFSCASVGAFFIILMSGSSSSELSSAAGRNRTKNSEVMLWWGCSTHVHKTPVYALVPLNVT